MLDIEEQATISTLLNNIMLFAQWHFFSQIHINKKNKRKNLHIRI